MKRVGLIKILSVGLILLLSDACTPNPHFRSDKGVKSQRKIKKQRKKTTGFEKIQYGISSYYGPKFHGKLTANGEIFDMYKVSAAHRYLAIGTLIKVTNLDNNKTLNIRINDRGPYVNNRILDCSYAAALKLGFVEEGTANIKLEVLVMGTGKIGTGNP
ncbi:MAG: septal ring lytic transglycosylase RlpA family protein [Candidatus Marinimicrobia bacterium]|nr:septal ring lytic transglycosylase RlpA family protein [Candidatus Neomarinimicrobiota bacterium]